MQGVRGSNPLSSTKKPAGHRDFSGIVPIGRARLRTGPYPAGGGGFAHGTAAMSSNSTGEAAGPLAGSATPEPSATSTRLPLTPLTIVAMVAPGFIVFALPMIGHIARNEEFFEGDYLAGRYLYGLGLVTVAIGFGLWALTTTTAGRFLFSCYVLLTPGWILYTALGGWRSAPSPVWS